MTLRPTLDGISDHLTLSDFPDDPYEIDEAELSAAAEEEPFARAAFENLRDLATHLILVAGIYEVDEKGGSVALSRDEAVVAGLMVRCMKLVDGVLQSASSPQRMEHVNFFVRAVIETAVNLRYLMEVDTPETFDSFVRYSLRTEADLKRRIESNITDRGGNIEPIEERMLASIEKAFRIAGLDPTDVDPDERGSWAERSIYGRFKRLGLDDYYTYIFATGNHSTHGNWHELYAYHLTQSDGGFLPDVSFGAVRPQPLLTACFLSGETAIRYAEARWPEAPEREELVDRIARTLGTAGRITELHEQYLARVKAAGLE